MPDVSIVVVTLNDPRITACLESLLAQQSRYTYEVVVVDGGSTDGSLEAAQRFAADDPKIRLVSDDGPFMVAWNRAAKATDTPIVARVDSDTQVQPGWLDALVRPISKDEVAWTAGYVVGPPPRTRVQGHFDFRTRRFLDAIANDPDGVYHAPSWNVAYRRAALEEVGWFDETLPSSEDLDLHQRLKAGGFRGSFERNAILVHDHPDSLGTLLRKEVWYQRGRIAWARKHGWKGRTWVLHRPVAYAGIAVLLMGGMVWWPAAGVGLGIWGLLGLRQVVSSRGDPLRWARPVMAMMEGLATVWGTWRGLVARMDPR